MNNEQERLKRLRERQLTDRDPLVKQNQLQRTNSQRERKARSKKLSLTDIWTTMPHIYRAPFQGLILGLLMTVFLPKFWISPWAVWVGIGATIFLVILGIMIGNALDLRDELRDHTKR